MPYVPGSGGIDDVYHAKNVYINGVLVATWEPPGGVEAFMLSLGLNPDGTMANTPENQYLISAVDGDDIDFTDSTRTNQVQANVAAGTANGTLTDNSVPASGRTVTESSNTPPNTNPGTPSDNPAFNQYTDASYPANHPIYSSLQLTSKTSLAELTTKAALWSGGDTPKTLRAQKGLSVPQILNNMANLAANSWEPIKAKYPNAFVTNSFRQGENQAQHGTGQAMDIQFKGIAAKDYYNIAQWIRDNVPFDQLLLEVAGRNPWIHISYWSGTGIKVSTKPINRVATMVVGKPTTTFTPGLQQVA